MGKKIFLLLLISALGFISVESRTNRDNEYVSVETIGSIIYNPHRSPPKEILMSYDEVNRTFMISFLTYLPNVKISIYKDETLIEEDREIEVQPGIVKKYSCFNESGFYTIYIRSGDALLSCEKLIQ